QVDFLLLELLHWRPNWRITVCDESGIKPWKERHRLAGWSLNLLLVLRLGRTVEIEEQLQIICPQKESRRHQLALAASPGTYECGALNHMFTGDHCSECGRRCLQEQPPRYEMELVNLLLRFACVPHTDIDVLQNSEFKRHKRMYLA
ncbi:unnamed protein product, partial [Ectocarpus sp. 13 AM-2016]